MFSVESAKQWAAEHSAELDSARLACEDATVQMLNRSAPEFAKQLWDSGCWLSEQLRELGATEEQIRDLQFAAGQRSFARDTWQVSVDYANEFARHGTTEEHAGEDLAVKIIREMIE